MNLDDYITHLLKLRADNPGSGKLTVCAHDELAYNCCTQEVTEPPTIQKGAYSDSECNSFSHKIGPHVFLHTP